jgi:hypothetical protein
MQCVGIKQTGVRCTVMVVGEAQHIRCKKHMATLNNVGPNQIRREELRYTHMRLTHEIYRRFRDAMHGVHGAEYDRRRRARDAVIREEDIRYQLELHGLEETINRETDENGGINADLPFIQRRRDAARARREALEERWRNQNHQWQVRQQQALLRMQPIQPQGLGELAALAHDPQNIHTAVVVQKVKENMQKILQIPVPPEYQTETLKTSGEIILECGLSKQAACQMMAKYCQDDDIYDLGYGIYARILNSVWQFIKASPDSEDLKKILKTEMEDNIGMCAQGNLSRLCNILSGYLEGINVDVKSKNETIGERLALLMDIDNVAEREAAGLLILEELHVPREEHDIWLHPLVDA